MKLSKSKNSFFLKKTAQNLLIHACFPRDYKHFFGTGEQAVEIQLYIALITYCLLTLIKQKTGYAGTLLELKRCLCACLYEPFPCFVKKLYSKGKRQSRGRRKVDHERIYQETLKQVIAGEADHLDDLTYDPVML